MCFLGGGETGAGEGGVGRGQGREEKPEEEKAVNHIAPCIFRVEPRVFKV